MIGVGAGGSLAAAFLASWWAFVFDPALLRYAIALAVAGGFLAYRLALWAHRPPTAALCRRGLRAARRPSLWFALLPRLVSYFAVNRFVWRRSRRRWGAHWPIMAGCATAFAIVVPLIFGWMHFATADGDPSRYRLVVFGVPTVAFATDSVLAGLLFHGLVWAGLLVLVGVACALHRRRRDRGERAVQGFANDLVPLLLLAAVSCTGLGLFVSYTFFAGAGHPILVMIHAVVVIALLVWLPFGKLIHVPQRGLKLAHFFAEAEAEAEGTAAACARCGLEFAPAAQVAELKRVEARLGYRYAIADGEVAHYQDVCPRCRRHLLVTGQSRRWRRGVDLEATRGAA